MRVYGDPNEMRRLGVSEVTIAEAEYTKRMNEVNSLEKEGKMTSQQATIERVNALEERDRKNIESMKRSGVSSTTINSETADSRLRSINAREESGMISREEALRQRAEAIHDRDMKNVEIMKQGGVSQGTISSETQRAEERYQQLLSQAESFRQQPDDLSNSTEDLLKKISEGLV
jgi:hypothetical protein